jgi:hypothetical protein
VPAVRSDDDEIGSCRTARTNDLTGRLAVAQQHGALHSHPPRSCRQSVEMPRAPRAAALFELVISRGVDVLIGNGDDRREHVGDRQPRVQRLREAERRPKRGP